MDPEDPFLREELLRLTGLANKVEEKKVQLRKKKENLKWNLIVKHPVSMGHYKKTKIYK